MSARSELVRKALFTKSNVSGVVGTGKLSAIYHAVAPEGATFPYGIIQRQANDPTVYAFQQTVILEGDIWTLKVITDSGTTTKGAQELAEELLATWVTTLGYTLTLSGATVAWMARWMDMPPFQEQLDGRWIFHRGTMLRIKTE